VAPELFLDDVRQGPHHHQPLIRFGCHWQIGHHAREALILTLGKGGLNSRSAESRNPEPILVQALQTGSRIGKIQLDHL